jgi:hypothetical protein
MTLIKMPLIIITQNDTGQYYKNCVNWHSA